MISDRRMVELALPAAMLYRVFNSCVARIEEKPTDEELSADLQVLEWLREAAVEPFTGTDRGKMKKLASRTSRVQREILFPLEDRPAMTAFVAVLHWLKNKLDSDELVLVEGSNFDKAVSMILENLAAHEDIYSAVEKSAIKAAKRIDEQLKARGYFV